MKYFHLVDQRALFTHRHGTCFKLSAHTKGFRDECQGSRSLNQTSEPEDANKKKNKRQLEVNAAIELQQ